MDFLFSALSAPLALVGVALALAFGLAMLPRVMNALLDVFGYDGGHFEYPPVVAWFGNFYVMTPGLVGLGMVLAYLGHAWNG
ncbi:MAG: hypothetical protein HYV65_03545 [Candidatus Spechtbacteria bacterium]|nr:hypothetical protein [Candidatus Spechtbacteria bacterium]